MIIGQDVLRLLTIKALLGRTWAGDRVFDSPAQPADLKIEQERAQFIGVYTDEADVDLEFHSLHNPEARVYLLLERACADRIVIPGKPNGATPSEPPAAESTVTLAQTDQALELVIGFLSRQAIEALMFTDNVWAELWRQFTSPGRIRVEVRRGGPGQQGQQSAIRYASRILRMQLSILADPVYGEPIPKGFWAKFLAACEGDPDLGYHGQFKGPASIIKAHIETTPSLPSWRVTQKRGTYTVSGLQALGVAPLAAVIPDEAEPPILSAVTLEEVLAAVQPEETGGANAK